LGRGAYATVFKAIYRGSVCAAKQFHSILTEAAYTPEERRRLQDNFRRECDLCSKLDHPNIVHFIAIHHPPQPSYPVMIMELMDESLTTYAAKSNISFKIRISVLHDVAEGLSYLHSRNPPVIHRDLSPNNILLKHLPLLPVAKIGDLGVAKVITKKYHTKAPGTMDFMPPEAFADKPQYDTSLDVFSYGGIILHTVNGQWPKPTAPTTVTTTHQLRGFSEVERRQKYLDGMTGEAEVLRPLVEACLDNYPAKRPSIIELSEKIKPLYLDKMTNEGPLVEACLGNDPVKHPSIIELSEKIKPLKVCLCHSYCMYHN